MSILIGIDDTDTQEAERGTGMLARWVASQLGTVAETRGVTRHQLLVDPRIPYTSNNSCNVVHLKGCDLDLRQLFDLVAAWIKANFLAGSDPGLCVAGGDLSGAPDFGRRAQSEIVTAEEARQAARERSYLLEGLGGTNLGVIGAVAGVELAASGSDGRFVEIGRTRELQGRCTAEAALEAGVEGWLDAPDPLPPGSLVETNGRIRPQLVEGKAKVRLRQIGERIWETVGEQEHQSNKRGERGPKKPWIFRKA